MDGREGIYTEIPRSVMRNYGKVYNLGHRAIADLLKGPVIVEEKVDGSQFSFGRIDGQLICRTRRADATTEDMFQLAVRTAQDLTHICMEAWVYRAEFLRVPKHNALAYDRVPDKNLILFDVDTGTEDYLSPAEKASEAVRLGLEVVPLLKEGEIRTHEELLALLGTISCLGGQKIEGVVIKNYGRFGVDGHALKGKCVSDPFREARQWKANNLFGGDIKQAIGASLCTPARWEKAIQHLRENGRLQESPTDIGPLIKEIQGDVKEECGDQIKEQLFKWAWRDIQRVLIRGFPEWYKEKLIEKQFCREANAK